MATGELLKRMAKAYADGDDVNFRTVVLQIAAQEARQGHSALALELKKLADEIGSQRRIAAQAAAAGPWLSVSKRNHRLSELVVPEDIQRKLQKILQEYRNRRTLEGYGLSNRKRILLEGAPGTGKTQTAAIFASELHIPLYTVRMELLVSAQEAETDARMQQVLEMVRSSAGVFLLTGCETVLAGQCKGNLDWTKRWLPYLLEEDCSESILAVEWNGKPCLDRELIRKFDDVLSYGLPTEAEIRQLLEHNMAYYKEDFAASADMVQAAMGLSPREIVRACEETIKEHILSSEPVSEEMLYVLLLKRRETNPGGEGEKQNQ